MKGTDGKLQRNAAAVIWMKPLSPFSVSDPGVFGSYRLAG